MKRRKNRIEAASKADTSLASALDVLKNPLSGAIEEARAEKLFIEKGFTQREISEAAGKSRSAVANDLRLLTLDEEVLAMVERGELSAGHARTLVRVPKEKQLPFAKETIKGGHSVREAERAVKMFLTPPEILRAEKQEASEANTEALRSLVKRMRAVLNMKVSLVGNVDKGRVYIDYLSNEELRRIERCVELFAKETGITPQEE